MSDVKSKQKDETQMLDERSIKFTPKGLGLYIKPCQEKKRSSKCNQASKYMEKFSALMGSHENVSEVSSDLNKFIKCYQPIRTSPF